MTRQPEGGLYFTMKTLKNRGGKNRLVKKVLTRYPPMKTLVENGQKGQKIVFYLFCLYIIILAKWLTRRS
jgi:hypothetical protein